MKKILLIIVGIAFVLAAIVIGRDTGGIRPLPPAAPAATLSVETTQTVTPTPAQTVSTSAPIATTTPAIAPANNITLTAGGKTYGAYIAKSESVIELMRTLASGGDFTFIGKDYPSLGFFVESINGVKNGDGKYWILYINGTSSDLGASSAIIKSGDTVEWRFEKGY